MKKFDLKVVIHADAFRVEAENENDAICKVYDECKNHPFLVIEKIESEIVNEREEKEDVGM